MVSIAIDVLAFAAVLCFVVGSVGYTLHAIGRLFRN